MLPSYNGSRKIPNLTALLAMLLAQHGVQVLVHGPARDPARVTTAEIFHDLGLPCATSAADVADGWSRREPVFVRTDVLCPALARLLDVRRVVGLRNSGHTVAKLLAGCQGPALRVVNYTHPEYGSLLAEFLATTQASALLMRGTEGEPVADARRLQAPRRLHRRPPARRAFAPRTRRRGARAAGAAAQQRRGHHGQLHPVDRERRHAGAGFGRRTGELPARRARRPGRTGGAQRLRRGARAIIAPVAAFVFAAFSVRQPPP